MSQGDGVSGPLLLGLRQAIKTENNDRFPWTSHATIMIDEKSVFREAFDFDGIYTDILKEIGKGIRDGLNSSKAGQNINKGIESVKNGYDTLKDAAKNSNTTDWEEKGKQIGNDVTKKLESIDWDKKHKEAEEKGKKAAEWVNGFFGAK